jgi:hypothetical protein
MGEFFSDFTYLMIELLIIMPPYPKNMRVNPKKIISNFLEK